MEAGVALLPAMAMWLTASAVRGNRPCTPAETIKIPGAARDRIVVEQCPLTDNSPRLRIYWRGGAMTIQPEGGLVSVREGLRWAHDMPANKLRSKWVYAPSASGQDGRFTIVLFGHAFASDPGSIRVVRLASVGRPQTVYSDDTFQLDSVVSRPGRLRLIGHRSLTQMTAKCIGSYDPASVVQIGSDGKAVYSLSLSREYNLTHGYVWAGPTASEEIRVNVCKRPARIVRQ